jgi:hypothetical protein
LAVSHQPSSFLAGVTATSADFTVGSIIRLKTPLLASPENLAASVGRASYTGAVGLRQAIGW